MRRLLALLAGAAVLAVASPAAALPAGDWWRGQLDIARAQALSSGSGVTVGLVDTGVQASLPGLSGRVLPGHSFVGRGTADHDVPYPGATYFGHGTAMASLIAGSGRNGALLGVAPRARILPTGVSTSGKDDVLSTIAPAIRWSVDHGARIIDVSAIIFGQCADLGLQSAVDYAVRHDVIVVAPAGDTEGIGVAVPAMCPGVIAVGGIRDDSRFLPSDTADGGELDFVAPAENIRVQLLTGQLSEPGRIPDTQKAAALVAGTFALLRSRFPTESARQIVTRALWNVHNGLGGKIFAKRIDNRLGYGEILPRFALSATPPANATNPIYDAIQKHLAPPASSSPVVPPSSPTAPASGAGSPGALGAGSDSHSAAIAPAAVIAIAVLAVAVVAAFVFGMRSRRRPAHGGYPPGPPQSGPPYGPPQSGPPHGPPQSGPPGWGPPGG